MKKVLSILLSLTVLTGLFFTVNSCSDSDDNPLSLSKETISAKWGISTTGSEFTSIEFNKEGNYIVTFANSVKSGSDNPNVFFGEYQILDDNTIKLNGYGKIIVSYIDETSFKFTIIKDSDPTNKEEIVSTKATEIANSTNTELFCRTWLVIKYNGVDVENTTDEKFIVFTKAGTYLIIDKAQTESRLSWWGWTNSNQTEFGYFHIKNRETKESIISWDNTVQILELTKDSLKLSETQEGEGITETWDLVPAHGEYL